MDMNDEVSVSLTGGGLRGRFSKMEQIDLEALYKIIANNRVRLDLLFHNKQEHADMVEKIEEA